MTASRKLKDLASKTLGSFSSTCWHQICDAGSSADHARVTNNTTGAEAFYICSRCSAAIAVRRATAIPSRSTTLPLARVTLD